MAATLSKKLTFDVGTIFTQLRARPKKSPVSLVAIEAILEIMEESWDDTSQIAGRSAPKFSLGDKVATDWSDDWGGHFADFGEIVGLCYLPPENTWIYYVNWTHSNRTDGHNNGYPIFFEGESEITDRLRFSNHV